MEWYWWIVVGIGGFLGLIFLVWLLKPIFIPLVTYLFARRHSPRTGEALENIARRHVPGFEQYKTEEDARTAQKRQRVRLAGQLDERIASIRRLISRFLKDDETGLIEELDRLNRRLEKVADRIRYATYGYSALFAPVDEDMLNRLFAHDQLLESTVSQIASTGLEGYGADLQRQLETVNELIDHLDQQLNERPTTVRR